MSDEQFSDESSMWDLLKRPKYQTKNWRSGKTTFDGFWTDFAREEGFTNITAATNLPLEADQITVVAYEQAILLSAGAPEFNDVVHRVRVILGIPMLQHKELLNILLPNNPLILDPLDIRHRCSLLLNPEIWGSRPEFVERQLWVIEQTIISKWHELADDNKIVKKRNSLIGLLSDAAQLLSGQRVSETKDKSAEFFDRLVHPCFCLTKELQKRASSTLSPLSSEKELAKQKKGRIVAKCIDDPLCKAPTGGWEENLANTHTLYLVASLFRILTCMVDGGWFTGDELSHFFCLPLWSCIVDASSDDFLYDDHKRYVCLMTRFFHLPFDTMALFAASRIFHHIMIAIQDGDIGCIPESAMNTVHRLLFNFDDYFASPGDIANCKRWKESTAKSSQPRTFLIRRVVTAEFRDQLVFTLKDYRKYVQLNGLVPLLTILQRAMNFVDPPGDGQHGNLIPTLIRWCICQNARQQTARALPPYYRPYRFIDSKHPKEHEVEKEQQEILTYMTHLAKCMRTMTDELPIEQEHFSTVWDTHEVGKWAKLDSAHHMQIALQGMRDEMSAHLRIIASKPRKGGPWRYVKELPPGLGPVATESVAFEMAAEKYTDGCDANEREKFFNILQGKIDVAMSARLNEFDRELVESTFAKKTLWEPVNPSQNLLHSQGVMDLWHFIFEARETLDVMAIPLALYSHTFLDFVSSMVERFQSICYKDIPPLSEYEMQHKATKICSRLTDEFVAASTLSADQVTCDPDGKQGTFSKLKNKLKSKVSPLKPAKPGSGHTVNELIVRLRSVSFFMQQLQLLSRRFRQPDDIVEAKGTMSPTTYSTFASGNSRALHAEHVKVQWLAFINHAEDTLVSVGKQLVRYFCTVVVYADCDYMFERVYCKPTTTKTVRSLEGTVVEEKIVPMSFTDVLQKEMGGIQQLLRILRPPSVESYELSTEAMKYFSKDGFSPACAQGLVKNFTHAWFLAFLDCMARGAPLNFDVVTLDSDSLQNFANEILQSDAELGVCSRAVQIVITQNWSPPQFREWARLITAGKVTYMEELSSAVTDRTDTDKATTASEPSGVEKKSRPKRLKRNKLGFMSKLKESNPFSSSPSSLPSPVMEV